MEAMITLFEEVYHVVLGTFQSPRKALCPYDSAYTAQWFNPDNAGASTQLGVRCLGHYAIGLRVVPTGPSIEVFAERPGGNAQLVWSVQAKENGDFLIHTDRQIRGKDFVVIAWVQNLLGTMLHAQQQKQ